LAASPNFWDNDAPKFIHDRWQSKPTSSFDKEETLAFLCRSFQGCNGKLLDIGCGPGFWLRQEIFSHFTFRLGIDSSLAMVQLATRAGVPAMLADAHSLPLESNQFDAVIVIHVLEYSPNPLQFLTETRRVLRPGGRCCIITKNKFGLPWLWAKHLAEIFAPNPLTFNCLTIDEIGSIWESLPLDVAWISARLITDLNDVNDAVKFALPIWMENFALSISRFAHFPDGNQESSAN
jgi:SAM-dependent methyltransferase